MLRKIGGVAAQIAPWAVLGGLAYAAAFISPQIEPLELPQPLVESRDMFFDVAVAPDGQSWFVGTGGTLLIGDIEASTWQREVVDNNNLQAITFDSLGRAVIVGNGGWIYSSNDQGASWQRQQLPLSSFANKLTDVTAIDDRFYVIGEMGAIFTSRDLSAWESLSIDEDINFNNIYVDGDTLWIAAEFGTLLHSNDAGMSWTRQELGEESLQAIAFAGENGIVVGNQGFIAISSDAGGNWVQQASIGNEHLYDVSHQGQSWLIVGDAGTLLVSNDNASSWQSLRSAESGNQYFARATRFGGYAIVAGRVLGKLNLPSYSDSTSAWSNLPNATYEVTP